MSSVSSSFQLIDTTHERRLPAALLAVITLLATIFIFLVASTASSIVLLLCSVASHAITGSSLAAYGFIADACIILGIYCMMRWFGWNWRTIGLRWPKISQIGWGVLAFIPYFMLYLVFIVTLKAVFPALNIDQKQEIGFESVRGGLPLLLAFVSLVILPPLVEEIVMRGFLYTGLRRWLPTNLTAIVISVLFGAAHLTEGGSGGLLWIGAIDMFTLSLVLVALRAWSGNVWPGIALHAVKNLVAFAALFIIGMQ
jgi:membrane protease YdiL (CAAX protease family)